MIQPIKKLHKMSGQIVMCTHIQNANAKTDMTIERVACVLESIEEFFRINYFLLKMKKMKKIKNKKNVVQIKIFFKTNLCALMLAYMSALPDNNGGAIMIQYSDFSQFTVTEQSFAQGKTAHSNLPQQEALTAKQTQIHDTWLAAANQKINMMETRQEMMHRNACRLRMILQAFALAEEHEFIQVEMHTESHDDNLLGWRHVHIDRPVSFCKLMLHYIMSNISTWNFFPHIQAGVHGEPVAYCRRRPPSFREIRFFVAMEIPQILLLMRINMVHYALPAFVQATWERELADCENLIFSRCSYDDTYQSQSWFQDWITYESGLTQTRQNIFEQWYQKVRLTLCQGLHCRLGSNSVMQITSGDIILMICRRLEDFSPW